MIHDLTTVDLTWKLTCYGINVSWQSGSNIISGDFSPEESRHEAYQEFRAINTINGYAMNYAASLQRSEEFRRKILADPTAAVAKAKCPAIAATAATQQALPEPQIFNADLGDFTFGNIPDFIPQI